MQTLCVFNLQKALSDIGDDLEIYKEILEVYLQDTPNILNKIQEDLQRKNIQDLNRLAHSLKSSSRTIGALRLGEVAAQIEQSTSNGAIDSQVASLVTQLEIEFTDFQNALREANLLL